MITFKAYLAEARMAPLYHASSMANFFVMANHDMLRAKTEHKHDRTFANKDYKNVISLTRSFKFAKDWAIHNNWNYYVILELNQQKLAYNYKLIPYNHFQDEDLDGLSTTRYLNDYYGSRKFPINQYEENVIGDIKPLNKYLVKVYYSGIKDSTIKEYTGYLSHDIPVERIK